MIAGATSGAAEAPPGYDTVYGYLARTEPFVLDLMHDFAAFSAQDSARAAALCRKRRMRPVTVRAPEAVVADGGAAHCPAFPLAVLDELYAPPEALH